MPKITNYHYRGFNVTVAYQLKSANFSIVLPVEMANYGHQGKITADTQAKVQHEFEKTVDNYIKEGAERKKFIAISVENDSRCEDEFTRADGCEGYLKMQYAIVTRVKINGEFQYKYSRNSMISIGPNLKESNFWAGSEVVYMEWTEKREEFLQRAISSIQELATNVKKFIQSDTVKAMIDSNKQILKIEFKEPNTEKDN